MRCGNLLVVLAIMLGSLTAVAEPVDLLYIQGVKNFRGGAYQTASEFFRQVVGREPDFPSARHYLGLSLIRAGKVDEGRRVLSAAARRESENARLMYDLGLAYLAEGNNAWAARTLREAKELNTADPRIGFHLGVALLRLGETEAAVEELRAVRQKPELNAEEVDLQLALAEYQQKNWRQSRALLDKYLWGEQGAAARQLVRAAHNAEGNEAAFFSGMLQLGSTVDTNPVDGAEGDTPWGAGPTVAADLGLRPYVDARHVVSLEASGDLSYYFAPADVAPNEQNLVDDVNHASLADLAAGANARKIFPLASGAVWQMLLGYTFGTTFYFAPTPTIAYTPPVIVDDHGLFSEQHLGHLQFQYAATDGAISQLRISSGREFYALNARSNWRTEIALQHGFPFWSNRAKFLTLFGVQAKNAESSDYHQFTPQFGLGTSVMGPWRTVYGLSVSYLYENHYDSEDGRWVHQRIDNKLDITAEASKLLPMSMRLTALYHRHQNMSTIDSFDYSRDSLNLNLAWSF